MMKSSIACIKYQRGMSTIFMSTIMVVIVSLMSVYAAQVSVLEQKISANHYRGKQAFEAAQAALDIALSDLDATTIDALINSAGSVGTQADLNVDIDSYKNLRDKTNTSTVGQYRLTFKRPLDNPGDNNIIEFNAFGFANDVTPEADNSNANQRISMRLRRTSLLNYSPPASFVAKGNVDVDDSDVSITNDTGEPMAAVWAGGGIQSTAANIDVTNSDGETDPSNGMYANDANLAGLSNDDFFRNFFSLSKADMKAKATVVNCESGCSESDLPAAKIIWVDAYNDSAGSYSTFSIENAFSLGTVADPVILIVDGNFKLRDSSANVTGMVYTTQNFSETNSGDRGNITGSLITEGNINISKSVQLTYNNDMFNTLQDQQSIYTRIAGSWKDFQ